MTPPVIKRNRKSIDVKLRVIARYASGDFAESDMDVRVPIALLGENMIESAIALAKKHTEKKLINFVRFA
jgi:hypothetical protein